MQVLQATFFNKVFVFPILNVLLLIYLLLNLLHIPYAFGFSIIFMTIIIRLLLQPFFLKQAKMAKQMESLKPKLDAIQAKYKNDAKKLQEEQMKLYKDENINPASGCLFALIQMPVFIGLYNVFTIFLVNGGVNKIASQINNVVYFEFLKITGKIDPGFFGLNLAVTPNQFGKYGYFYLLIPVITAFLQYLQIDLSTPKVKNNELKKNETKSDAEEMQKAMGTQMKIIFPLMIGWISYTFPVGLALYWNIFSIFSILQYKNKFGLGLKHETKK